ncbi:hypothetical protein ACNKHK_15995 [Shigella flexneri]
MATRGRGNHHRTGWPRFGKRRRHGHCRTHWQRSLDQPDHEIVNHFTWVYGRRLSMEGISHEACSLAGTLGWQTYRLLQSQRHLN